jgi:hypothetical protein
VICESQFLSPVDDGKILKINNHLKVLAELEQALYQDMSAL